ncbi:MAG: hypothetical protein ABIL25_06885, partial [candidate division WOR-3 bacterium]
SALAFGGANFLVVWQDYRGGRESDIYGARVTPGGTVLDPAGIAISTAADNQRTPSLAFGGANFLVVWTDARSGGDDDIYGARVSSGGTVLDPQGIPISTAANGQHVPALAFDGANFLVVWFDLRSGNDYDIYGARVTPAGTVLDPQGFAISTAADWQFYPVLAFSGTNFLVVWQDDRSGSGYDIYGAHVTPSGTVLDPAGIAISTAAYGQQAPALAFDGTNFLVVWQDNRSGSNWDIYGARVTPSGTVLDPAGIAISTAANSQSAPALAFGGNFLVVWRDERSGGYDIYGARVTSAGAVLDPAGIAISTAANSQSAPALAFDGRDFLVVWADDRSGGDDDIYGARVSSGGTIIDPQGIPISTAAYDQLSPALAFGGANFLVVWQDNRGGGGYDIYGARVSSGGNVLDPQGFPVSTAAELQEFPVLAFDGANFLVVWQDNRSGGGYDIYGARVSPAGTVFDEGPVVRQEGGQFYPAVARGRGSQLLLVYSGWAGTVGGRTYNTPRIWGKFDPLTGFAELPRAEVRTPALGPTIIRNILSLPLGTDKLQSDIALLDASGRNVLHLKPGANDVSHLAPGVYFVRENQDWVQSARRIVIQH